MKPPSVDLRREGDSIAGDAGGVSAPAARAGATSLAGLLIGVVGIAVMAQAVRTARARRRIIWEPGHGTVHRGALHARVLGAGAPGVLLLHGLGGSNAYWGAAYDGLATMGGVVIPDLLGFGDSPRPPAGYAAPDHVDALLECLGEIGVEGPLVVAGHSVGCLVALALAHRRPDLVSGVVALCPPLYPDAATARAHIARLGCLERQLAYGGGWARRTCRWVCAHPEVAAKLAAVTRPGLPARVRRDGVRHSWASYSSTFRHLLVTADAARMLAELRIPVDLVAGADDRVTDIAFLRLLADQRSSVSLTVEPGDHDLPLLDPKICLDIIAGALLHSGAPPA